MFVVTLTNILALFLTILDSSKILKNGMKYGFIIVTVIAAIRYDYGNDYMSYMRDFDRVGMYSLSYILEFQEQLQYSDAVFKDLGAVLLFRLFNPLGFFFFAGLISSIQGCIYYQFIKENVRREYYWIAIFLYLFQFEFYLLPMSMIRQGLSIALFVWAWHFVREKKIFIPVLLSLLSISIHKSAVIFIPFLIISYIPLKNGKITSISLLICLAIMFLSSSLINSILDKMTEVEAFAIYFKSYEGDSTESIGLIRKILAFVPFLMAVNYIRNEKATIINRTLVMLSTIGTLILPFTSIIALISRLCYYFNIFMIGAIPISIWIIKGKIKRYSLILLILASTAYQYYDMFFHSIFSDSFIEYHTIFSILFKYMTKI